MTINVAASQVEIVNGIACATVGTSILAYDLLTGDLRDSLSLGSATLIGLACDEIENVAPAVVMPTATITLNDGHVHRSSINSINVAFNTNVSFPAGLPAAATLTRNGPGGVTGSVPLMVTSDGVSLRISFPAAASDFTQTMTAEPSLQGRHLHTDTERCEHHRQRRCPQRRRQSDPELLPHFWRGRRRPHRQRSGPHFVWQQFRRNLR
ncbi:hypothetical protein BH11PLA2_BH11PLA2_07740 [soil metagenome]